MVIERAALFVAAAWTIAGCGGGVRVIRAPGGASEHPTSIAVLGTTDAFGNRSTALDDACATGLLLGGVRAVERQHVDAVLAEHSMSRDGEQGTEYYRRLGAMTGADAFVMSSISGGGVGTLVFRTRLISATSGDVLLIVERSAGAMGNMGTHDVEQNCTLVARGGDTAR